MHAEVADAAAGRSVWLVGGGELVGQFANAGLLDEIIAGVTPAILKRRVYCVFPSKMARTRSIARTLPALSSPESLNASSRLSSRSVNSMGGEV